jgi:Methane oxygenase PmoA
MSTIEVTSELPLSLPAPVRIPLGAGVAGKSRFVMLREIGSGIAIPAQLETEGSALAVLGPLEANAPRRFRVEDGEEAAPSVEVKEAEAGALDVLLHGKPFTRYHCAESFARPFCYPVLGPGGKPVTRNYPMRRDVPGETHDHPHHRSLWTAYGEVNGVDDWSEEPKHGFIRHQQFREQASGPVFGGFVAENLWSGPDGVPLLRELRSVRVYAAGSERCVFDYDVILHASEGDVHFGDTKEGGLIAFRVASSMDAKKAGRIENADGGVGEHQCWGKPSNWCDYSGPVEGVTVGIAVMDHPQNFRHPCHWHVRDYGLMATNVFGDSSFANERGQRGAYTLKKGEHLTFRYRVLLHRGNASEGKVSDAFHGYVQPPVARLIAE